MLKQIFLSLCLVLFIQYTNAQTVKDFQLKIVDNPNTSIRAVHKVANGDVWFAGSNAHYGISKDGGDTWDIDSIQYLNQKLNFRALGSCGKQMNLVTIENPGMIFRTEDKGNTWYLSYYEEGKHVFYDAVKFYDSKEGIALGDPIDGCFSILRTYDGGQKWYKLPCSILPKIEEGEAAFAASNSNIAIKGDSTWIVTGGKVARVLFSANRGKSWEIQKTPIVSGGEMTGIYSVDFYDHNTGVIIGGDWNNKNSAKNNKAITYDGGKTWQIMGGKKKPPYQSCIKFVPGTMGKALISVGIPGVYFSKDSGKHWIQISKESFYALTFVNNKKAVLTGHKKIATLSF